jgi:uncharacterized protein
MRISNHILPVALFSLGLGLTTAYAFDGRKSPDNIREIPGVGPLVSPSSPADGGSGHLIRSWVQILQSGDIEGGVKAADDAFHNDGDAVAGWQLGRMYAFGERGVSRDPVRAFGYFHEIADNRRYEEVPDWRPLVANAHVELGLYYLNGIPNSPVRPDPVRAHNSFYYAAYNFRDAAAQYYLGRTYLEGQGVAKDPQRAAQWIYEAANKGQCEAQAKFGSMLVQGLGQVVQRDIAKGLMWLKVAVECAPDGEASDKLRAIYTAAFNQATLDERGAAEVHYERWRKSKLAPLVAGHSPD